MIIKFNWKVIFSSNLLEKIFVFVWALDFYSDFKN